MNKELIIKKFKFGRDSFSEWLSNNSDVQHLILTGELSKAEYANFKKSDILNPSKGIIILDMQRLICDFTLWDYYSDCSNGCCEKIIFPEGITDIEINSEYFNSFVEVVLPKAIKNIGAFSFSTCAIFAIDLPEGLRSIGYGSVLRFGKELLGGRRI